MSYLSDWRALTSHWRADLVAGVTVGIVALPLALGFAITTGAPASAGLITAVIAGFVAALFGGSNYQVSGPTGAMTVVLVPLVAKYGINSLFLIGVLAGTLIVLMSILRLGKYIDSVPWSVMEGFTLGIALIIGLQQVPLIFEVPKAAGTHTLSVAIATLKEALSAPINWASVVLALFTLTVKRLWPRLKSKLKIRIRIPASMLAVIIATLLAQMLELDIARIGDLPSNLFNPPGLVIPEIPIFSLAYAVVVVALLGAVESLLSARVADAMAHKEIGNQLPKHNPDKELFGQGLATIASAFSGGLPATGAIARTTVNVHAGARTRFAAMTHSAFLLLVVLFLAPLVSIIPTAALAGVLLGTSIRIANPTSIKEAWQTTNRVRIIYVVTAISVLLIDLIWGVLIGIVLDKVLASLKRVDKPGR